MPNSGSERRAGGSADFDNWRSVHVGVCGYFFGLTLVKFGNPVILEKYVTQPSTIREYLYQSWPVTWGYYLLVILALASLPIIRLPQVRFSRLIWLPAVWLFWQFVSATQSVDGHLTRTTLGHFSACVACFYLGLLVVGQASDSLFFWGFLGAALVVVLAFGFSQRYGGLEQTRRALEESERTGWRDVSQEDLKEFLKTGIVVQTTNGFSINPEARKRLASSRVFGTLVYPNALAGVILLLLPVMLAAVWKVTCGIRNILRGVLTGLIAYAGISCLYWSESKAGWLIALAMGMVLFWRLNLPKTIRWGLLVLVLVGGTGAFWLKFNSYFRKGAPSVGARFDYWRVAGQTLLDRPVFGSGPGTFYAIYQKKKLPESEMTRLTHNDYLEQGSDSGLIGLLAYAGFILGSVGLLYRKSFSRQGEIWGYLWLGIAGWALQGFVEFGLYIPALAWTGFLLLGILWSKVGQDFASTSSPKAG